MDLHDYLRVVRKRWRTITAVTLVLVAAAALLTLWSPKTYQARTQLFVSTSGGVAAASDAITSECDR